MANPRGHTRPGDFFSERFDYDGDDLIYYGVAEVGTPASSPGWQIVQLGYTTGNLTSYLYAGGRSEYDQVWDDRATLTYT